MPLERGQAPPQLETHAELDAAAPAREGSGISIVVPVFNELENLEPLVEEIVREARLLSAPFELIIVNDGSQDGSAQKLDQLAAIHAELRVIHFSDNFGQTSALAAGLEAARGGRIVTMDGDLQNDPSEMAALLECLDEGYGCVSGWRKDRHDDLLRRLASRVANRLIARATSLPLHDYGCTLKAYRADALDPSELYGEMHRFLPVYVRNRGGRVAELPVRHRPRVAGTSKYGFARIPRVLADLALVRLLFKYRTRPVHLFSKVAAYLFVTSLAFGVMALLVGLRGGSFVGAPLAIAALLSLGSLQMVSVGLCCELVMRNHFYVQGRRPWKIERAASLESSLSSSIPGLRP